MTKPEMKRSEYWRQLVAEQERSGLGVRTFCEGAKVSGQSFYHWRARLWKEVPVRFALVEPGGNTADSGRSVIEVTLASGEQLRIGAGVGVEMVRMVLAALRG